MKIVKKEQKVKKIINQIAENLIVKFKNDGTAYVVHQNNSPVQMLFQKLNEENENDEHIHMIVFYYIGWMREAGISDIDSLNEFDYFSNVEINEIIPTEINMFCDWVKSDELRVSYVEEDIRKMGFSSLYEALYGGYISELDMIISGLKSWILDYYHGETY